MPIDSLTQVSAPAAKGAQSAGAVNPVPAPEAVVARQTLPGSGNALPPEAVAGTVNSAEVRQAVSRINDYIQTLRRDLHFSVDEDSGRSIIKVVDSETGETVRQIPAEDLLAISRVLANTLDRVDGIILNDRA